ncbi:hypothetical protein ASD81_18205 [Nocardioides sp. Root614]|nr:hypothetical protein ASD81_18205 [Nocardioides sp. Root614]KRA87993.1 hypothetical protein ASD84_18480 [Nocardioides sp. Root682]
MLGLAVVALAPAPASVAALPPQCSAPDANNMVTCSYTDQGSTEYTLPIPSGTTSAQVRAVGQRGAPASGDFGTVPGGSGALVTANITSIPAGSTFKIRARADGGSSSNGGGAGGGSAAVRFGPSGSETDLVIAAGGGGAGEGAGGPAGAPGEAGSGDFSLIGGGGGQPATASTNGSGGLGADCGAFGGTGGTGGAGTTTGGGAGGAGAGGESSGGGGGGGRRGGGGGGGGCSASTTGGSFYAYPGGGAGGLSLVPAGGTSDVAPALEVRNVRITFQVSPVMAISPTTMSFGNVRVGTTSAAQTVVVSNPGGAPFTVSTATFSGNPGFQASTGCTGVVVQPGASCSLTVTFAPTTSGTSSGTLFVNSNAPNSPRTVLLTGTGVTPIANLSPTALAFPATLVGQQSSAQGVTLQNTGPVSMTVSGVTFTGTNAADFVKTSDNCTNAVLSTGQSCTVQVAFKPQAPGSRAALLSFADNAPGTPHQVSLSGAATQPAASLTPSSLTFADMPVGQTSPQQPVTMRNVGSSTLTISGVTFGSGAADFQKVSDGCTGAALAPNASCVVQVAFRPTVAGTRTGVLFFADNAPGNPHSVSLTGSGLTPLATLTPTSVDFGTQGTGTTSASRTVTLRNSGNAPLTVSAVTMAGTHPVDFPILGGTCVGAPIAVGATCTVQVAFAPTAPDTRSASLQFTDNAPGSPHVVSLIGSGSPPVVSVPANQSFGDVPVGSTGAPREVLITNTGLGVLEVPGITVVGANPGDFILGFHLCEGSIDPGDSCAVPVSFRPGATGARTATLRIADNAAGSPHQVSLTGSGVGAGRMDLRGPGTVYTTGNGTKVTLGVTGPNVAATYRVKVTNTGSTASTYEFNLVKSGAPANAGVFTTGNVALPTNGTGNQFTASIAPGAFIEYLVKVTPTTPGQNISTVAVRLLAPNGAVQDTGITETNVKAPATGTDGYGLFATANAQPYIGGSVNGQSITANTVALNGSAAFTVRLRNDGTTAHPITLKLTGTAENCWTSKVTVAGVDVTAAAYGSGYVTPSMAIKTQKDVVVTVKRVLNGCGPVTYTATSFNGTTAMHFSRLISNPTVPPPPNTTPSLQVYGPGSVYTAFGNTVTKPVTAAGVDATYTLRVTNTTINPSSFKIALTKVGAPSNARVYLGTTLLPKDANGNYITPTIATNGVGQYVLKVATTDPGRTTGVVMATLLGASGPMATLTTETNVQAPATGSDAYGLYAKEGTQAFIGMLPAVQAVTAPSLALNGIAKFTVRLRNDSAGASPTRLRLSGPGSACFTATAALGTVNVTSQAFSSSGYPVGTVAKAGYKDVVISVKRISKDCASLTLLAESLNEAGVPQHAARLITNRGVV